MGQYRYSCGRFEDRFFATLTERNTFEAEVPTGRPCKPGASVVNKKCQGRLKRQLSAPNFKVNGYCAKNGYEFNGGQTVDSKNKGVR
jgi:hypothetical protein